MIFQVMRMLGPPKLSGTKPEDVKPTPCAPVAIAGLLVIMVLLVVFAFADGGQVKAAVFVPLGIIAGIIVLGGILVACAADMQPKRTHLLEMPVLPTPRQDTDRLREAVARRTQQTCEPQRFEVPSTATLTAEPAVAPAPARTRPRKFVSLKQILTEEAENTRLLRIAAILVDECPTCTAKPGVYCTFQPGQLVHMLDRERSIVVHGSRIGASVKAGHAKIEDVKAQFEGNVPDDVWRHAL